MSEKWTFCLDSRQWLKFELFGNPIVFECLKAILVLHFYNTVLIFIVFFILCRIKSFQVLCPVPRGFVTVLYHFWVPRKLIRCNRPPANIRSKSDSDRLLINFSDLNLAIRSIVATISFRIWIQISILNLIYIENWSKNDNFWPKMTIFNQILI